MTLLSLQNFFQRFDYPVDAQESLLRDYQIIQNEPEQASRFNALLSAYEESIDCDFDASFAITKEIAKDLSLHEYSVSFLLCIGASMIMKKYYEENGYDEALWENTAFDLKYKAVECKLIYGVWGTFVPFWFPGFFRLKRFGIGRLQFETVPFPKNYDNGTFSVKQGDPVITVHIPRTGGRLDRQETLDAYRRASVFFKERFNVPSIFVCNSWLLFPLHDTIFKDGSNLRLFFDDFDIFDHGYYPDYAERWRLFDCLEEDFDKLPSDSSFRRAYIDLMKRGEKLGWGYGIFRL